jgi:SAM-dependent methyltransferase
MTTEMTPEEWDRQFARQARWTRAARIHLYRRVNLLRAGRVLDVGSGTGTVTEELATRTQGQVVGVDLDTKMVAYAQQRGGQADYRLGDTHDLSFRDASFDVTACHFLLMWCRDPGLAAREMIRVTRPGGAVLVCAEPDYGGRREGADPGLGRALRRLFGQPAVRSVEVGLIPGLWDLAALRAEFDAEWALWEQSLADLIPPHQLAAVKAADRTAIESGERFVFVPVFYALVRV